jgi:hypothetical protein
MSKLKIGTKISIAFLVVIILTASIGGTSYYALRSILADNEIQSKVNMPILGEVNAFNNFVKDSIVALMRAMIYDDITYYSTSLHDLDAARQQLTALDKIAAQYPKWINEFANISGIIKPLLDALETHFKTLENNHKEITAVIAEVRDNADNTLAAMREYNVLIRKIITGNIARGDLDETDFLMDRLDFVEKAVSDVQFMRISILRAQSTNDASAVTEGIAHLDNIYTELINEQIPVARRPEARRIMQALAGTIKNLRSAAEK